MTDATKHTPGPWETYDEYGIVGVVGGVNTPSEGRRIAIMDNEDESPGEYARASANVRLVAAAPEMLEALREVERELDAVLAGTVTLDAETLAQTVSAAIAKATGSAS